MKVPTAIILNILIIGAMAQPLVSLEKRGKEAQVEPVSDTEMSRLDNRPPGNDQIRAQQAQHGAQQQRCPKYWQTCASTAACACATGCCTGAAYLLYTSVQALKQRQRHGD